MSGLMRIGVVGAGVMGAGIAQVAALAGHPVHLLDARPGAAEAAQAQVAQALARQVDKGRLTDTAAQAALAHLQVAATLDDLRDCGLVIEAIVEQVEPKRALLRELDARLPPQALIGSNTSSISITLLANGLQHPERLVGMHFFNPVPLMQLVEVVCGAETAPEAAEAVSALARAWGKQPVLAASTPGFIVNRIARPYYAEALALLQERAGTPAQIDACLRAAGFRMGPCELMDLIGHDTNSLVTRSVWEANFGDRRYQPSLVQQALVDGGRLGRKSGRGFFAGESERLPVPTPTRVPTLRLYGRHAALDALAERLPGVARESESTWTGLRVNEGAVDLVLTDGRCAAELGAHHAGPLAVMDWATPGAGNTLALAWAPGAQGGAQALAADALACAGWRAQPLRDLPGLVVARTLAMLVNEASDAVWQDVCTEAAADTAMQLGVNYPQGPFAWRERYGAPLLVDLLDRLWAFTRNERYRVSAPLRLTSYGRD